MAALCSLGPHGRLARLSVPVFAAGLGLVMLFVVPRSELEFTTYAGTSRAADIADLAAGLGLLGAGLLIWLVPQAAGSAVLVIGLAGLAWFAPDWVGWEGGPPIARSIGMVVEPFFLAFVFHVLLAAPGWRLRSRRVRIAVGAMYAGAAILSIGRAFVRDPFLDPYCWSNCTDNVFLINSQPVVARALDTGWIVASIAVGLVLAVVAIWRFVTATRTARRALWPILVPAALVGMTTAARAVALVHQRLEMPEDPVFSAMFQARAWSVAALAVGIGWVFVRARRTRAAVARLASDLGAAPPPGSLGHALARATGDPSLHVAYRLPGSPRYVDASGKDVERPDPDSGWVVTSILRDSRELALVIQNASAVDSEQLEREIGPAARLAVENERLQAEELAQLEDLRASRARIVEAADDERRQLERNLHDGAQQRLLALSYDLRRAVAEAEVAGEGELSAVLRSAGGEAQHALAELRDLAHGIYPAILAEAGIRSALSSLADSAPIPLDIREAPDERFPEVVERAAFVVVSEAVQAAHQGGSSHVGVRAFRDDHFLVVEVVGAGPGPFVHIADRVGALGGDLTNDARLLRAGIPCE